MADTRRNPIASDALKSRGNGGRNWTPPTPDPGDRDGTKSYGTARTFPDPNAIRSPRKPGFSR